VSKETSGVLGSHWGAGGHKGISLFIAASSSYSKQPLEGMDTGWAEAGSMARVPGGEGRLPPRRFHLAVHSLFPLGKALVSCQ